MQSLNVTVPNFAEQMWVQLWFWGELGSGSTPSPPKNTISPPIAGLDPPHTVHWLQAHLAFVGAASGKHYCFGSQGPSCWSS